MKQDQIEDYTKRKEMAVDSVERWLNSILGYERDKITKFKLYLSFNYVKHLFKENLNNK